jgi:hypothetical protein
MVDTARSLSRRAHGQSRPVHRDRRLRSDRPRLRQQLVGDLSCVLNAYTNLYATLLVPFGSSPTVRPVGGVPHRVSVFAAGSAACVLSPGVWWLVAPAPCGQRRRPHGGIGVEAVSAWFEALKTTVTAPAVIRRRHVTFAHKAYRSGNYAVIFPIDSQDHLGAGDEDGHSGPPLGWEVRKTSDSDSDYDPRFHQTQRDALRRRGDGPAAG